MLGIEEDADDGQIKKAYRKLALKFHPDKNQGNEEEASKHFREVQSAYAVLIEPQERAWYDKHKDAILMKSGDYEDKEVALGEFFSPHCYSGFGDDANGFYGVYGVLFKQISEDDYTFMNNDEDDFPQFGDSFTDASFVVQVFYGFWQSYATKRTYVWEEEYDTREAPSRWVRRKMEQVWPEHGGIEVVFYFLSIRKTQRQPNSCERNAHKQFRHLLILSGGVIHVSKV